MNRLVIKNCIPAIITAVGSGIGSGGSILYASLYGRKKRNVAAGVLLQTEFLFVEVGILLMLLLSGVQTKLLILFGAKGKNFVLASDYTNVILLGCIFQVMGAGIVPLMRSVGLAIKAMVVMTVGMLINMAANYTFLFGLHMGIKGTAYGTVLSQSLVCFIGFLLLERRTHVWKCKFRMLRQGIYRTKKILLLGIASFGVSISATIVLVFTNWQCLRYGGTNAVAFSKRNEKQYACLLYDRVCKTSYISFYTFGNGLAEM